MKPVDYKEGKVRILDQSLLPDDEEIVTCRSAEEVADAILKMKVRGAPAIGVAAAYGMAVADELETAAHVLKTARPTAVDLKHAVDYVLARVAEGQGALEAARDWDSDNSGRCMRISRNGAGLINNKSRILTHCNTGFLAADSYGTALGAIVEANRSGKEISVLVDETRPRIQGSLTSWELLRQKVEHRVIADSAAGYLMAKGEVDMVMLGADRIASNGDFANKIGTYSLSVLAKENNVPFYVLAPISTYDFSIADGSEIEVENRDEDEVLSIKGKRAYPKGTRALNPAFDITPAKNVTAYINEWGTFEQIGGIRKKWNDMMG